MGMANKIMTIGFKGAKGVSRAFGQYDKISKLALSAAVNRTQTFAKTQLVKSIRAAYEVSAADVRGSISDKKKATPADPVAVLRIRSSLPTIYYHFKLAPKFRPGKRGPYSIAVTIKKGQTKKMDGRVFLPSATSTKKNTQLWMRSKGRHRVSTVKPLHTLSFAQMVNDDVQREVLEKSDEMLKKRLDHEMEYRMEKLMGRLEGK
jgi:hypothetical protein